MAHIGIDLGTTNSVVSIAQHRPDGRILASPIDIDRITDSGIGIDGKTTYTKARAKTLPSCVFYKPDTGKAFVGDFAKDQYKKYPEQTVKSVKSQMTNPILSSDLNVPDKTPAEVSAKILSHLKNYAELAIRQKITTPIIAVPANLDAAGRIATMIAADLAGFDVKNEDGSWKPLLISEPNAVLYDLSQKLLNGEISETLLNLDHTNRVLLFDIGGGTLDVTIHEIARADDGSLNLSEIATSRYTRLAGDDFDTAIADALYERCLGKFNLYEPEAVPRLRMRQTMVKKMLRIAAERLKIDMSAKCDDAAVGFDDWFAFDDMAADAEPEVEISQSIGDERIYNDIITKSEFEAMVEPFLGKNLNYNDYKGYAANAAADRKNIISPILDVLEKAHKHYEKRGETFRPDAVILNGGMSKLYLIRERIREFFGLEPITTADPDLSVANGAAVYAACMAQAGLDYKHPAICIDRQIQNEDLWLGLSAGANVAIIAEGDVLPCSNTIEGFRIAAETKQIILPIKRKLASGEYETMARGIIAFNAPRPKKEANLEITCEFDRSGLLSICAHLTDEEGRRIDTGAVEIALGETAEHPSAKAQGSKILPPKGATLIPANELDTLRTYHLKKKLPNRPQLIESRVKTILSCGNPSDFEEPICRLLCDTTDTSLRLCLYRIADAMYETWTTAGRRRLTEIARNDVVPAELGLALSVNPQRKALSDVAKKMLAKVS